MSGVENVKRRLFDGSSDSTEYEFFFIVCGVAYNADTSGGN